MNINGDRWRAGTGCQWMAFCSASDSSAPLMGSAWLDSIMSPDTLWRGCKFSIRPPPPPSAAVFASFPVIILPSFTLLLLPISSSYSLHILARPPCFRVRFVSICPEDIDMSRIQVGWNNERGEGHAHAKFKENTAFLQSTCWHFE